MMKRVMHACLIALALTCTGWADGTFLKEYGDWRQAREQRLASPDGWLTLAGLFWLHEGDNTFGSDPTNDCVFPSGKAPARVGTLRLLPGGALVVRIQPHVAVLLGDVPVASGRDIALDPAAKEGQQRLSIGTLSWYVIRRGDRVGIRLKDSASAVRAAFHGVPTYPPDPAWRMSARLEPASEKIRSLPTAQGMTADMPIVGTLVFEIGAVEYRLEAYAEPGDDELTVIFGDKTNERDTYPAGRYLEAARPDAQGRVVLDFNRAYNPPCAFTHFATCSLPSRQNCLPIAVEAGEKRPK